MKDFKMRYKDFVFPQNPKHIEISSERDLQTESIYGEKSNVEDIAQKPIKVTGNGTIYGKEAQEVCSYLSYLLKQGTAGELHCPSLYPINAYFKKFVYSQNATKDGMDYSFSFVEVCSDKREKIELDYTVAQIGENAFDIAYRTGVSIDMIMEKNNFPTPFDIKTGDKVVLK